MALTTMLAASSAGAQSHPNAAPASSSVQSGKEEAVGRFRRGLELYDEQDYNAALIEFRRAYELSPNHKVLYNIGQVCFQLQDYACALRSFETYLFEASGDLSAERRKEVQAEIAKLQSRVAKLTIATNVPDVEITIDDVAVGKTPLAGPVLVSAGKRRVGATRAGYAPLTRTLDVPGAETIAVDLKLIETASSAQPAGPRPSKFTTLSWVGLGVAGALGVGAAITGVAALSASSDLEKARFVGGTPSADIDSKQSSVKTLATVTDVLGIAAIATAGVTLALTLTRNPEQRTEPASPAQAKATRLRVGPTSVYLQGEF